MAYLFTFIQCYGTETCYGTDLPGSTLFTSMATVFNCPSPDSIQLYSVLWDHPCLYMVEAPLNDLSVIPHEHLETAYAAVTRAGLQAFYPDLFGPARSRYNQLHRHLAVTTFQATASWFGFTELEVSITVALDTHLLCEIYDNFVFGTIARNSRWADTHPGGLQASAELVAKKKRRERLCMRRYEQAKLEKFRKPILRALKQPACHSDDELITVHVPNPTDPTKYKTQACEKPYRNDIMTQLCRYLDTAAAAKLARTPNAGRKSPVKPTFSLMLEVLTRVGRRL
ncbi:hypothetical protein C8F01DRAFT_1095932 [Mycena amicta]|nr:hypothetical protein C8F01DRAFT_1095932 [Mycena amicta]